MLSCWQCLSVQTRKRTGALQPNRPIRGHLSFLIGQFGGQAGARASLQILEVPLFESRLTFSIRPLSLSLPFASFLVLHTAKLNNNLTHTICENFAKTKRNGIHVVMRRRDIGPTQLCPLQPQIPLGFRFCIGTLQDCLQALPLHTNRLQSTLAPA